MRETENAGKLSIGGVLKFYNHGVVRPTYIIYIY